MKNLFLTSLFAFIGLCGLAQQQPTDCTVTQQIRDYYTGDAEILAMRMMQSSAWADSIEIEPVFVKEALKWLAAVHNAQGLPARDTVVSCLDIHADTLIQSMRHISLYADTTVQWAWNLAAGIFPTGHAEVDTLMVRYGMEVLEYEYIEYFPFHFFLLKTNRPLNTPALAKRFRSIEGVFSVSNDYILGYKYQDINIYYPNVDTFMVVRYQYGASSDLFDWSRHWKFGVSTDCSNITFLGSTGEPLMVTCTSATGERNSFPGSVKAYPLPASDVVTVEIVSEIDTSATLRLLTISGREIERRQLGLRAGWPNEIAFDLARYQSGLYVLLMDTNAGSLALKIPVYHID